MDADLGPLDALAANLRRLDAAGVAIATEAMPAVLAEAKRTAAAGTTPDGTPWPPKVDGERALPNASGSISATVSGASRAVLTLILTGPYVFHHTSKAKGRRRQILPDPADGLPPRMRQALEAAAVRVRARLMGGG